MSLSSDLKRLAVGVPSLIISITEHGHIEHLLMSLAFFKPPYIVQVW